MGQAGISGVFGLTRTLLGVRYALCSKVPQSGTIPKRFSMAPVADSRTFTIVEGLRSSKSTGGKMTAELTMTRIKFVVDKTGL